MTGTGPTTGVGAAGTAGGRRDALTVALYALVLCSAVLQGGLGGLLPFIDADLPMSHTVESLHITAMACGGLVAALGSEPSRRRIGRVGNLLVAGTLGAAGALGLALAPSTAVTVPSMALIGMGMGASLITGQAVLVALHGLHSPRMIGELNVAYSVGAVGAASVLPLVAASAVGWRGFAGLQVVLLLGLVLPLVVRGAARTDVAATARSTAPAAAPSGRPRVALVVIALALTVEWSFLFWVATYLTDVAGLPRSTSASAAALMWAAVLAGRVAGTRLVVRLGPHRLLWSSLALALLAFGLLTLARTPAAAFPAAAAAGLAAANLYPAAIALVVRSDPARADRAVARASLVASSATILSPLLLGRLADATGLATAFAVVPAAAVLAAVAVAAARTPTPQPALAGTQEETP